MTTREWMLVALVMLVCGSALLSIVQLMILKAIALLVVGYAFLVLGGLLVG